MELDYDDIPETHEVQPLRTKEERDGAKSLAQCGTCLLYWDDGISTGITPAPSARCPFEHFHVYEDDDDDDTREITARVLVEDFHAGCRGTEDVDMAEVVHGIIADVIDSVRLSLASEGIDREMRERIVATVESYVGNHYGDM